MCLCVYVFSSHGCTLNTNLEMAILTIDEWPPTLLQMNQLSRGGQKADLVKCLEIINMSETKQPPVDAIFLTEL